MSGTMRIPGDSSDGCDVVSPIFRGSATLFGDGPQNMDTNGDEGILSLPALTQPMQNGPIARSGDVEEE